MLCLSCRGSVILKMMTCELSAEIRVSQNKPLLLVITAAHCVYQVNKEDILILANSLANKIGKNKRFGETTHHVDEIRLHEDYVRYSYLMTSCVQLA